MKDKKYVETLLVLVLLLPFAFNVDAQFNVYKSKMVELKQLNVRSSTGVNISGISIISNLPNSSLLGIAPSALPNERTDIVVANGNVESWLQAFVTEQYRNAYTSSGRKLQWVINDLSVGTDSSSTGILSFTKLAADIYSSSGNADYEFTGSFDTLIISKNINADFGSSISAAIAGLYSNAVSDTSATQSKFLKAVRHFADHHLSDSNTSYRILTDKYYPTGIYTSFQQFLDNAPAIPEFMVHVNKTTGKIELLQLSEKDSSQQIVNNLWGIAVGNELYKYDDGQLYPIEKAGKGFMLSKYIDPQIRKNKGLYWRRNVGGRTGDYNPFDDKHIYRSPAKDFTLNIEATHLDMKTGNLTF